MLLMNKEKIQIDGVDIYPDHADDHQFWLVPGNVALAERGGDKVLSYLWYIEDSADKFGTGFLNFEVNNAVRDATKDRIRSAIASAHPELQANRIRLAPVSYDKGQVNFSVLGPVAAQGGAAKAGEGGVLHVSPEQIVWSAGSSSLVGDNAAVCSVKFTKDGKLAAAMAQAIEQQANVIAATYSLDFTALRPAVTFNVTGSLKEVQEGLNVSIGAGVPLEAFMLEVGTSVALERIMRKVGLKITVVDCAGADEKTGLDWAKQIVMEFILKNFFTVDLGKGPQPVRDHPDIGDMMQRANDVSADAAKAAKKNQADEGSTEGDSADGDTEEEEEEEPTTEEENATASAVKKAVASSFELPIPKVKIQVDAHYRVQENSIDFTYSEMKARRFTVAPQGLVLEGLPNPAKRIVKFFRGTDPFGLDHPVNVTAPDKEGFKAQGLRAINLTARYPAGAPTQNQQPQNATITPDKFDGTNPLPFKFDKLGSRAVEYDAEFVFDANSDWKAAKNTYKVKGVTESGVDVQPASHLGFLEIKVLMSPNFVWRDADQAIVTITCDGYSTPTTVVFQRGDKADRKVNFRTDKKDPTATYEIVVKNGGSDVWRVGPKPVEGNSVTVYDQFKSHVPITLRNSLKTEDIAVVTVSYKDPGGDYRWESEEIEITKDKKDSRQVVIPTLKSYQVASDLECIVRVDTSSGQYEKKAKGGSSVFVTDKPPGA